jgi:HK97 family phage major capsid protein
VRIKFLKAVVNPSGDDYEAGSFLTVEDEAVAKKYIDKGFAEEAPEVGDVTGELKGLMVEFVKDLKASVKAVSSGPGVPNHAVAADRDDPDSAPNEFDSPAIKQVKFGRFLQTVGVIEGREASAATKASAQERLHNRYKSSFNSWADKSVVKAANVESSGPSGGYAVPPEFSTEIWKVAVEDTVFASRARKRPMTSNEFRFPKLDQTGTTTAGAASGYLGGVVARWSRETATRPETEPKLRQGVMKAGELTGYSIISNELLQDNAAGLAALITELFAEAIAYYIDLATLIGDGIDKPVGVATAPATITSVTRGTASHVNYADLVGMKAKLFPRSLKTAVWIANQTVMTDLYQMKDGASRLIIQPYGPTSSTPDLPEKLLNIPIYFTEKTPVLGSAGDLLLVDPMGYMVGERMGLEIAASPHVNFLNNEMTYRFVARVAGQPILDAPFTMLDGTNQLSHFVSLQ